MIIQAFNTKIQTQEKEISNLHNIIRSKDQKYFELEKTLKINDLDTRSLQEIVERLNHENRSLIESNTRLTEENRQLNKMKYNVAASLENDVPYNNISTYSVDKCNNLNNLIDNLNANNYTEKQIRMNIPSIEEKISELRATMKQRLKTKPIYSNSEHRIDNSSHYNNVTKFFNECKTTLHKHEYDELVHTLKDADKINIDRVEEILSGQKDLFNNFKKIYKPLNN
jgi:chromosome segregation ATPase